MSATSAGMMTEDDYLDEPRLLEYLGGQLAKGRLALVLGAGISIGFGLPNWTQLIDRLYSKKGATPPSNNSPEDQAEYFRHTYYESDNPGFIQAVHHALYDGFSVDFSELRKHALLFAIGSVVMASVRGSASTVITLNFDDILEIVFRISWIRNFLSVQGSGLGWL